MTTDQILSLSRKKILEEGEEIVDDETLLIYANLTYQDLQKRVFPKSQILTVTVTFSSGVGTLPALFGTLYGDAYRNTYDFFPELSIDDFNKKTLIQSVTVEGGTLKVYPTTVASLSIKYYPIFAALTSVQNPTIESYFHEIIVYGVISRAFEDLQDPETSAYYANKYETELNKRISIQSNYEEENQRAGQLFVEQDLLGGSGSGGANFF